jgi:chemotaxis protein MotA
MEYHASEELQYLSVLKTAIVAFVSGAAPQVAVEFGRRVIPANVKPSFEEIEQAIRRIKK